MDSLLVRLEVDRSLVCGRIVKLLFNSFFPSGGGCDTKDQVKIQRCIFLVKKNRGAARRFYEHGEKLLKMHDCVKFMLAILATLRRHARKMMSSEEEEDLGETSMTSNGSDDENKENNGGGVVEDAPPVKRKRGGGKQKKNSVHNNSNRMAMGDSAAVSGDSQHTESGADGGDATNQRDALETDLRDPAVVAGLLDVVCILWVFRSREIAQDCNAEYRSLLEKNSAKILTVLFKHYRSSEVAGPVVYLCSLLPHSSVSAVASFCLSRLKNAEMPSDEEWATMGKDQDSAFDRLHGVPTYANALCNWGRGDDLLDLITEWLRKDCKASQGPALTKTTGKRKRGVRFAEHPSETPRPLLALSLVEYLLQHPVNRAILLRKNRTQLEELRDVLCSYLPLIKSALASGDYSDVEAKKFSMTWSFLLKLTVLLQESSGEAEVSDTLSKVEDCLEWLEGAVATESGSKDRVLRGELVRSAGLVCCNMVTIGVCDANFVGHLLDLCSGELRRHGNQGSNVSALWMTALACHEVLSWTAFNATELRRRSDRRARLDTSQDAVIPVIYASAVPELMTALLEGLKRVEVQYYSP